MPSEVRFADVRKLLEEHGWTLDRVKGSHHVFGKKGERPLSLPVHHGTVAHVYVRKAKKTLGLEP